MMQTQYMANESKQKLTPRVLRSIPRGVNFFYFQIFLQDSGFKFFFLPNISRNFSEIFF